MDLRFSYGGSGRWDKDKFAEIPILVKGLPYTNCTVRDTSQITPPKGTPYWKFNGKALRTKVDGSFIGSKYLKQRWDGIK